MWEMSLNLPLLRRQLILPMGLLSAILRELVAPVAAFFLEYVCSS